MKLKFYAIAALAAVSSLYSFSALSQGCVAVKNMGSCPLSLDSSFTKGVQFSLNYRFFRSYKHFVGKHEESHRVEQGTEVINNDNSINLGLTYAFNRKWSASIVIPYIFIDRSSMYEHLGNAFPGQTPPNVNNPEFKRFHTQSQGIGDIRLLAYYNVLPHGRKTGLTVGLGFKLPTGEYDAKDYFRKPEGLVEGVVDQSIQPGDGGLGTIIDIEISQPISGAFGVYANGMYMFNPKNTNGVKRSANLVKKGDNVTEIPLSNEFSVTDQYLLRAGARYSVKGIQASLGGRMECIPSKDLIGDSDGFRRPGYVLSIEPAVFYTFKEHTVGFNFPVAFERNRTQSQIDKARGINPQTGKEYHGDAAFADWLLSITYSYRLSL